MFIGFCLVFHWIFAREGLPKYPPNMIEIHPNPSLFDYLSFDPWRIIIGQHEATIRNAYDLSGFTVCLNGVQHEIVQ